MKEPALYDYPSWAEDAFIGATQMADTFAAAHILRAWRPNGPIWCCYMPARTG